MRFLVLPTLALATVLAAACGGDESTTTSAPSPTSGPTSSSSTGSGGATTSTGGGGGATSSAGGSGGAGGSSAFVLTSSAFSEGQAIPDAQECSSGGVSCMGMNLSPPLSWTPGPAGTQSYAIVMRDLSFNNLVHWVIWDIPASVTSLPEGVDTSAMPSNVSGASQSAQGYRGPCSCGSNNNVYQLTVYALDVPSVPNISAGASRPAAEAAVTALTPLATATLSGES